MQVLAIAQSKVNASIHKFVTCFYGRLPYIYMLDIDNFRDCPAGFKKKFHQDVKHEPATTANSELKNGFGYTSTAWFAHPYPILRNVIVRRKIMKVAKMVTYFSMMISMKVGLPPVLIYFCFVCSIINHPAIGIHPILGNLHLAIKWLI